MGDTGYHRLREGRYSEPGRIYLLTTVTHGRRPLFRSMRLARAVIACLRYPHDRGQVASLAFVVMPDHLHWLVQMQQAPTLAGLVGPLKTHSVRAINQRRGAPGMPVWQEGFHDRAIRREEDIEALARYVVANPLRAGLVDRVGDYPHWDAAWLSGSEPVF